MSKFKVWFVIFIIVLCPVMVSAHPGRLDSSGCHTCRSNCSKWGLSSGQYHCHGGSSSNNKSSNTTKKSVKKSTTKKTTNKSNTNKSSNKSSNKNKVVVKSTNVSLKSLSINNDSVDIKESMDYNTSSDVANLEVKAADSKATIKYDSKVELHDGINKVNIKVIAENTSFEKDYVVNIKKLSSDTKIKVYVDGNLVDFADDNVFDTDNDSVDIDYETSNSDASVEIKGDTDRLSIGDNVVKFIVKAEDGTTKEYLLIIKRNDINEDVTIDTEPFNMVSSIDFVYKIFPKIIYFIFNIIK